MPSRTSASPFFGILLALCTSILCASAATAGGLRVVTTTEDLAAIARVVGGEGVDVRAIARGYQDPHFLEPKPSLMLHLNRADLLIYVGLSLEVGWLPVLVEGARNPHIDFGSAGNLDASQGLRILELPAGEVSRSAGDVHPEGNPHYWLDPRNGIVIAQTIAAGLGRVDPAHAADYQQRARDFAAQLRPRIAEWQTRLAHAAGQNIICYHKQWEYLVDWLGLNVIGLVEEKAGIPPAPRHLVDLITHGRTAAGRTLLYSTYVDERVPAAIAGKIGITAIKLPPSVGAEDGLETYIGLFEAIVRRLEAVDWAT